MIVLGDRKVACVCCINGHRSKTCLHIERINQGNVFLIEDRGRPVTNVFGNAIKIRVCSIVVDECKNQKCDNSGDYIFQCKDDCCKKSKVEIDVIFLKSFVGIDYIESIGDVLNSERVYSHESQITSRAQRARAISPRNSKLQSNKRSIFDRNTRISKISRSTKEKILQELRLERAESPPSYDRPVFKNSYKELQYKPNSFRSFKNQNNNIPDLTSVPEIKEFPFKSDNAPNETMDDISKKLVPEFLNNHGNLEFQKLLSPVIDESLLASIASSGSKAWSSFNNDLDSYFDHNFNYPFFFDSISQDSNTSSSDSDSFNGGTTASVIQMNQKVNSTLGCSSVIHYDTMLHNGNLDLETATNDFDKFILLDQFHDYR